MRPTAARAIKAAMTGGNTVGAALRETEPRADGYRHIDSAATVERLRQANVTTYVYGIWDSPTDWDDLRLEFLPAAAAAGIEVWPYVVPPSESSDTGRASRPFGEDYLAWAREIAALSVRFPHLTAWGIDDFSVPENREKFTPEYVREMHETYKAGNPELRFWLCVYHQAVLDTEFVDTYRPFVDGFIYPFLDYPFNNTENPGRIGAVLDEVLAVTRPRGLGVLLLVYCGRFLDAVREPDEVYVEACVRFGLSAAAEGTIDGVLAYGMPVTDAPLPSSENRAMYGLGRLSLTVAHHVPTPAGVSAWAGQRVAVDPDASRHELSFWHQDNYSRTLSPAGHHIKQVLLDGQLVWELDIADNPPVRWINGHILQGPIDVSELLRGKTEAMLTVRLYEANGVTDFGIDVGFDTIETIGCTVRNPGFEERSDWTFGHDHGALNAGIDLAVPDRPRRIRAAIAAAYGDHPPG